MTNELMIGDYFYRPDCVDRVVEVRKNGVIGTDSLRGLIPWSEIKPIPLTKEILEKNGFCLDDGFKPHLLWKSIDHRIILHNEDEYLNTFNKWHIHVDTEDMRSIGAIELTYVHQFQQFLRLCGMNELANNFSV
ncbi:MAG: hypothetical protein IJP79_07335 [Paludibacteraceae bacterium]|nr:hypothetical protein [Paludibacteraceae bacterium]MBQ6963497.1 hypothetical protein [Paludibacteraceae bacterium]MBQ7662489.1 hypothetical protein [Prevotella sp.]MBQ7748287.1 hypothetical protein [Paludibacteraceae bacterium]